MNDKLLDKVSKKTNVDKGLIVSLVEKLSKSDMKDEHVLEDIITSLEGATGKSLTSDTKQKIIKTIKEDSPLSPKSNLHYSHRRNNNNNKIIQGYLKQVS